MAVQAKTTIMWEKENNNEIVCIQSEVQTHVAQEEQILVEFIDGVYTVQIQI